MVFLPNLNELGSLKEFANEDAVLLMDNCSSHVGEEVLSLLRVSRVRVKDGSVEVSRVDADRTEIGIERNAPRRESFRWPIVLII
jgi:hypothetical protein